MESDNLQANLICLQMESNNLKVNLIRLQAVKILKIINKEEYPSKIKKLIPILSLDLIILLIN